MEIVIFSTFTICNSDRIRLQLMLPFAMLAEYYKKMQKQAFASRKQISNALH